MPDPPFNAFRFAFEHRREVVWMSQNTNHLVPPAIVGDAVRAAIGERRYEGYPNPAGEPELHELVRRDLGLPAGVDTFVTAGATEALYMATRGLLGPGDEVIASDPSYLIIHRFVELSGARTVNLDIYAPPYRLTAERIQAAITPKTRWVLLIDPLNPLGSAYPTEEVRAIAEIAHDHHLLLIHDVTYRDFNGAPPVATAFAADDTLAIWSTSKNCGVAGLRLGGLAASAELVKKVARYNTNDLGVNVLAQVAAIAGLRAKAGFLPDIVRQTRENQARIRDVAGAVEGVSLPVYPSHANMFVIDLTGTGVAPEALQEELLVRHHVFLRAGNYLSPKFGGRFIRASFSNPASDVDRFAKAFPVALASVRPRKPVSPAASSR